MKTNIRFSYTEMVVPPRCRNPRPERFNDGVLQGNVHEISGDQAPVAIVSHPRNESDGAIDVQYRWHAGKLWTSLLLSSAQPKGHTAREQDWDYLPIPSDLDLIADEYGRAEAFRMGLSYNARNAKADVEAVLRAQLKSILIIDGTFYHPAEEPRFVVTTFGLGGNHGGTAVMVVDYFNSNIRRDSYFPLTELEQALELGTSVATKRGDTRSLPMEANGPTFEVLLTKAIKVKSKPRK